MRIIDGFCVAGEKAPDSLRPEALIDSMDENGVEQAVICADMRSAAVDNDQGNRFILKALGAWPGRFIGFATANPWYEKRAETSLGSALKAGCRGVYFHPVAQGFYADDPMVYPLIELCAQSGAPVYFQSGTAMQALPFQVLSLAKRYPSVQFIIGHMGANDFLGDGLAAAREADNIWLDTSLTLTCTMRDVAETLSHRMIFGSAAPRSTQRFELEKLRMAGIEESKCKDILAGNLLRLWGGSLS